MKRKLLSFILAFSILMGCTMPTFAYETSNQIATPSNNLGKLVDEKSYYDDATDSTVTERIYFTPDLSGPTSRAVSGKGWYTNEISQVWSGRTAKYYVKAYFKWGSGKISVSNPTKWQSNHPSDIKIVSDSVSTNVNWHWFHDCGYVKRTIKFKNFIGNYYERTITMRVNSTNGSACW